MVCIVQNFYRGHIFFDGMKSAVFRHSNATRKSSVYPFRPIERQAADAILSRVETSLKQDSKVLIEHVSL